MHELLSVKAARQRIMDAFPVLETEIVPIRGAVGRVLAEPIRSEVELPSFTNSSMDGFAVRAEDLKIATLKIPVVLKVVVDVPAGEMPDVVVESGQAARIMTGAPLPEGADAVVPVESTDFYDRQPDTQLPKYVSIYKSVREGENIRPKGQDLRYGEIVLRPGQRIRPQEVGLLAMLGVAQIRVHRKPIVAIFSTGDELLPVEERLLLGKIYDSNTYTLISLVEKYGGQPLDLGIVPDQVEAVQARLDRAAKGKVDLIISSAGVSVGAYDFVRTVLEDSGHLEFWRVNMRPGKPLAFGDYQGVPFIGLPGNPVSAFVGFEVFVRPALMKSIGLTEDDRPVIKAKLLEVVESDGRESYLRTVVSMRDGEWVARLTGHQGSGNLRSLVQANALLLVPSGVEFLPIGAEIDAWMFDDI